MDYSEKLKHPNWQKKRLKIFDRDNFTCQHCSSQEDTLNVHHIGYEGEDPWDTSDDLLTTLCDRCHEKEEMELKRDGQALINALRKKGFKSESLAVFAHIIGEMPNREFSKINKDGIYENLFTIGLLIKDDKFWEMGQDEVKRRITNKNTIENRKDKFKKEILVYNDSYSHQLLEDFFEYWTEPNKSGTKFKKELEKTWNIERRLKTWKKNNDKFYGPEEKSKVEQNTNHIMRNMR